MFKTHHPVPGTSSPLHPPQPAGDGPRKSTITLIQYDEGRAEEKEIHDIAGLCDQLDPNKVSWINIDGLEDMEAMQALGERFHLHPLAMEDVLHTGQRPKSEPYDGYLFIVAQMVYQDRGKKICGEQVSMFLGDHFLITVQEEAEYDVFDSVRERIRSGRGSIRKSGADYLAYALLDSIIDHYYPVLEEIGAAIEDLEDDLLDHPVKEMVFKLHEHKRSLAQMRRYVWPLRDVVNTLLHDPSEQITDPTKVFLRDCYDHTVQLMDFVENYKEITTGLMELYHSSVGLKTNEVMRVLTVITSIFIPLTFIAGIYGMNFAPKTPDDHPLPLNMPELYHPYGYVTVMAVMLLIAVVQLLVFRKMKWL
jgi:magnesium transporter